MCTMAMDNTAMTNVNVAPTSMVAEAGSREAPALPPGLLTEMNEAARPTKLFIGGISRHTTTKQLRDHFAQFGRVLDCVAMRQPDGRPRGFGYVTLDSPTAAELCLCEPQNIDNRIVDMKLAVPEGSGSYGTSPKEANFNMNMFAGHRDFNMDMYAGHGFNGWPDASDTFGNPWWNGASTSPHGQGLDCLELLRSAGELAVSQCSSAVCSPHGLPLHSVGLSDYGECAAAAWEDEDEPTGMLIPAEFQQPPGAARKMSAGAQEFVPMSAKAPEFVPAQAQKPSPKVAEQKAVGATPVRKAAAARAPLGELNTNVIMEVSSEDLLKSFKSPTNKLNDIGRGHLIGQPENPAAGFGRMARPTGLLLDDEDSDAPSPGAGSSSDSMSEPVAAKVEEEASSNDEGNDETEKPISDDVSDTSEEDEVIVDMDNLPSMGSAAHATGECKRCNFFPKGRCSNGKNCQFCHFPHDKRKPSRQEKRERRAAWLDQNGMPQDDSSNVDTPTAKVGPLLSAGSLPSAEMPQHFTGPLLSKHGLHQGGFPVYPEEELYRDETLAYSIFPGMPPIHATKLPAPLPLPGMVQDLMGPALPPGLVAPALSTQLWQPESSGPRALAPFLSTVPTPLSITPASTTMNTPTAAMASASAQAGKTGPALPPGLLEAEVASSLARSLAPLATEPTPTSAMSTPTAAMAGMFSTSGTQTGDYKCRRCEGPEIVENNEPKGCQYARDELLQLRDSLMKLPQVSEQSGGIGLRTQAIVASASN
jgi:hypothetical protein